MGFFFLDFNCWTQNCLSDQGELHQSRFYRRFSAEWDESHSPLPHWFYILFLEAQREEHAPLCFQWHSQCCHCFLSMEWERDARFFLILCRDSWGNRGLLAVPPTHLPFYPEAAKQYFAIKLKQGKLYLFLSFILCTFYLCTYLPIDHTLHWNPSRLFSGPFLNHMLSAKINNNDVPLKQLSIFLITLRLVAHLLWSR